MNNLAIIPARGGSVRLPRKNIKKINGKPLIGWVIEAALTSRIFDDVIVSTEDEEIAKIASEYGASVHVRSVDLATSTSKVVDVCLDVLRKNKCETFCCIYPTAALIEDKDLQNSYALYCVEKPSVLISTANFNFSPFEALVKNSEGFLEFFNSDFLGVQSQFFPEVQVDAGAFYWADRISFENRKTFFQKELLGYTIDELKACDINTQADFDKLKRLLNAG